VPTIRYDEEIGLVAAPARTEGSQRRYGPRALNQLKLIAHARQMGFSMNSIATMLRLSRHPEEPCDNLDVSCASALPRWIIAYKASRPYART